MASNYDKKTIGVTIVEACNKLPFNIKTTSSGVVVRVILMKKPAFLTISAYIGIVLLPFPCF